MSQSSKVMILVFSPSLKAVSGVSTHVNMLLGSPLAQRYRLMHFQVGREGRAEGGLKRLARFVFSPLQLAMVIFRHKPQIVHINTSMNTKAFGRDFVFLVVARLMGCRVVNQFHSGYGPQENFRRPLFAWMMRRFLRWSHLVVVLSTQALREHGEFDARVPVAFVPNAIDTSGFLDAPRVESRDGVLRLVFVGRLVHTKGLFEAIEAVGLLKAEGLRFSFKIAGSGSDEAALRKLIVERGLEQEIELLGPVFDEAKRCLWLESDVLVFPTYFEGLPYSLLEAMAAGCVPVICPVGGVPDVMQDGEHGLFVPVRDVEAVAAAIRRLAENRDELLRMSQAGRHRIAEQYTVDRLAARFSEIYERVG